MLRVLRQLFSISVSDFSDDEILHICGVLYVNAHEVPVTSSPCQAIFRSASLVEHSCLNNASKHFYIMYSDPMWGTANRQQHLYETKFFRCRCPRCLDPTELNTEFSSLRCPSCTIDRPGYLTPTDPLDHA